MIRVLPILLAWALLATAQPGGPPDAGELEAAVRRAPGDAAAWRALGMARISAGQLAAATAPLEKACRLEKRPGDSCYFLARNYHALAQYEAAQKVFDRALQAAPPALAPRVHRAAGLNLIALGRDEDAELHLRRAVSLGGASPGAGNEDPRIDLGAFLFRQGRLPEALGVLEGALQANAESARANLEAGRVLLQFGRLDAAAASLERAVALNPADWNAHLLLGRAYQRLGRDAEAERELQLGERQWRRKQP